MSIEKFRNEMERKIEEADLIERIRGSAMYEEYIRGMMSIDDIKKELIIQEEFANFIKRFTKQSMMVRDMLIEWYRNHPGIEPTHYYTYKFPFDEFRILKCSVAKPLPPAFGAESINLIVPCGMEIPEQTEFTHNNEYHLCDGPIPHFRPWYSDM